MKVFIKNVCMVLCVVSLVVDIQEAELVRESNLWLLTAFAQD